MTENEKAMVFAGIEALMIERAPEIRRYRDIALKALRDGDMETYQFYSGAANGMGTHFGREVLAAYNAMKALERSEG